MVKKNIVKIVVVLLILLGLSYLTKGIYNFILNTNESITPGGVPSSFEYRLGGCGNLNVYAYNSQSELPSGEAALTISVPYSVTAGSKEYKINDDATVTILSGKSLASSSEGVGLLCNDVVDQNLPKPKILTASDGKVVVICTSNCNAKDNEMYTVDVTLFDVEFYNEDGIIQYPTINKTLENVRGGWFPG